MDNTNQLSITIKGRELPVERRSISVLDLKFNPENPRIYSEMHIHDSIPDQEEILKTMLTKEHVKVLINQIRANGGVTDPLIVRGSDHVVIEGNSRLAACHALFERYPNNFAFVKCDIIQGDISDDEEFLLLTQYHIEGKKQWEPYEIAGLVWRRYNQGADKKALQKELKNHVTSVRRLTQMIEAYQLMIDYDIKEKNRWSYFEEYLKSSHISKARKKYPDFDEVFVRKINEGEIEKAIDVRNKLSVIARSGQKIISDFLQDKDDFENCYLRAKDAGHDSNIINRIDAFRRYIVSQERLKEVENLNSSQKSRLLFNIEKAIKGSERIKGKIEEERKNLKHTS